MGLLRTFTGKGTRKAKRICTEIKLGIILGRFGIGMLALVTKSRTTDFQDGPIPYMLFSREKGTVVYIRESCE